MPQLPRRHRIETSGGFYTLELDDRDELWRQMKLQSPGAYPNWAIPFPASLDLNDLCYRGYNDTCLALDERWVRLVFHMFFLMPFPPYLPMLAICIMFLFDDINHKLRQHIFPSDAIPPASYELCVAIRRLGETTKARRHSRPIFPHRIVPVKPEEDLERLNDISPAVLQIVITILGFKPGGTDFVPRTLRTLFEATNALPVEG
ncbi:hypothetical protein PG991_011864 [Apiospora marii]|uniref:Uncharacterized protein n=1 Tax=Apiospora marii TaxID=335849 RepID=A0ABR1RFG0_9PEZI